MTGLDASAHMFAGLPPGKPSLRAAYEAWLKSQTPLEESERPTASSSAAGSFNVGIIGGGIAGLYAGLLLSQYGVPFHIFEARNQVGGRVFTYRFSSESNQYFEAGAMRLPDIPEQQPVFWLIDFLNENLGPSFRIETVPYVLYDPAGSNRVHVNARNLTLADADAHPDKLGFGYSSTASSFLSATLAPFLKALEQDFDTGFAMLMQYDDYSMFSYLSEVAAGLRPRSTTPKSCCRKPTSSITASLNW